jgi:antitoxin VapB
MQSRGAQFVSIERRVKIFKNGRNRAIRIPRRFELRGENAVAQEGEQLLIKPSAPPSLLAVLATFKPEDFPPIEEFPQGPVDL